MASKSCLDFEYRFYNGGWSSWQSKLTGGYAGKGSRVVVLRFETPKVSGSYTGTSLSLTIPYVRQENTSETGTIYVKLYADNPTSGSTSICDIPTSSTCDDSFKWDTNDQYVHKATFTITKSINAGEHYYLVIGASANFVQIGYNGYDDDYDIDFHYTTYTDGENPTITVLDKGNNTVTISGALGKSGSNNAIKSAGIYYTLDGSDPQSASSTRVWLSISSVSSEASYTKTINIAKACTVKAYTVCKFTYNTTNSSTKSVAAKYYVAPKNPGAPVLSYNKNRLTVKEPWTFTWTAATQANTNSPVKGYYFMLLRCPAGSTTFSYVRELTSSTTNNYLGIDPGSNSDNNTNYFVRRESTSCTAILNNPAEFGFVPGDKVKLRIKAFTRNGANGILQSDSIDSTSYTIQNAGIVNVKVNNNWIEGQVFVKVNNTWHEAETVNVNVNGTWSESE